MAKKITLTVNESLFSKIDQWRSSFNLSKVFQDAVSEAIKAKEELQRMLSGKEDIPRIIERLRAEKSSWLGNARRDGEQDGGAWASHAHYKDLVQTLDVLSSLDTGTLPIGSAPSAENQCVDTWLRKGTLNIGGSPHLDEATKAYREGWRTGVRSLWDLVKDQVEG